jgi:serine protease
MHIMSSSSAFLLLLGLIIGSSWGLENPAPSEGEEVAAASAAAACVKPPTLIFNDDQYYREAFAVQNDSLKLRSTLSKIISINWQYYTYSCMWTVLQYTDEDPNNSSNVILIYSHNSFPKAQMDTGTEKIAWNREHVWPKSKGFPSSTSHPYNDAHHLRAADKRVNNMRNNKDLREGGNLLCVYPYQSTGDCQVKAYQTTTTFEVPDQDKGDIARMLFYMDIRYAGQSAREPDIMLVNRATGAEPHLGYLCNLVKWAKQDPVSQWEKDRHERIYEWHLNRNPFVDHPEWVDVLFGAQC